MAVITWWNWNWWLKIDCSDFCNFNCYYCHAASVSLTLSFWCLPCQDLAEPKKLSTDNLSQFFARPRGADASAMALFWRCWHSILKMPSLPAAEAAESTLKNRSFCVTSQVKSVKCKQQHLRGYDSGSGINNNQQYIMSSLGDFMISDSDSDSWLLTASSSPDLCNDSWSGRAKPGSWQHGLVAMNWVQTSLPQQPRKRRRST